MKLTSSILVACFLVLATFRAAAADPPVRRRVAIVVGANAPPPGRSPLRFAYDDARSIADVLARVGRFAGGDIHLLLDPTPTELLQMVDDVAKSASDDALVLFYYSGHSDGQSLYPHGEALAVTEVRDRLSQMAARVRVGVLDTCRGGNWTQAKGISVGPPLEPVDLLNVSAEGTALVSSSSGFESAHEADEAHGSFFTHYFTAGLLGAADTNGDGDVTLEEAYEYARERTVRDSARLAPTPQHPSYDLQLRGRQDIVLASVRENTSAIEIDQPNTPIEVIHLPSGITLAEVPPSSRAVRIAVPPARYLVRRVALGRVYSKEVDVGAGETVTLAPGQLEATGTSELAVKGGSSEPASALNLWSVTPGEHWLIYVSAGVGTQFWPLAAGGVNQPSGQYAQDPFVALNVWYRFTERLALAIPFPQLSYRFGNPGGVEVMTTAGFNANSYTFNAGIDEYLFTSVATRLWTATDQHILLSATVSLPLYKEENGQLGIGSDVDPNVYGGYSWTIARRVTLSGGIGYQQDYYRGVLSSDWLNLSGAIDVRVAPQVSLTLGVNYADEIYDHLGLSYESAWVGATRAF